MPSCRTTPATYPVGDSAGVEFVCSSVTSNNLKDITGTPPRTASIAVEQVILANNRHIKYLNFDDHGFSVLDITSQRAQMDWFVIGDRADRDTPVTWTRSFATKTGTGTARTRSTEPVGAVTPAVRPTAGRDRTGRRTLLQAGAPAAVLDRRRGAAGGRRGGRRADREARPTCWSSTAAGPTRSTAA